MFDTAPPWTMCLRCKAPLAFADEPGGPMPLGRITDTDVRAWVADLSASGDLSPATVREAGQVLSKVMSAAVDEGLIARSPCHRVRLLAASRREMIFLEPRQIADRADTVDPHYRVLVLWAAYVGLRWGELAGSGQSAWTCCADR